MQTLPALYFTWGVGQKRRVSSNAKQCVPSEALPWPAPATTPCFVLGHTPVSFAPSVFFKKGCGWWTW